MSFWQCPACIRESYFSDKTHLKIHLMSEHNISGKTLTRIIDGLIPAFELKSNDSNIEASISENEFFNESEMKNEEEVHQ